MAFCVKFGCLSAISYSQLFVCFDQFENVHIGFDIRDGLNKLVTQCLVFVM